MDRLKVGILFGGCSEEHPISVKSAQEVAAHLNTAKYEPFYIGITQSGAWRLCDGPDAGWEDGSSRPAVLSPDRNVHGLMVLEQGRYETIRLDLVLPVLHGKLGEDGAMQGLLELSGIPYAGFVKPARSGSSFGVSKVSRKEELPSAVQAARQYDAKLLIEEPVVGSEIGCAVLGNDGDVI